MTCDERLAWEGAEPEAGPIRVEVCTYAGKPAYFEVVPRWRWDAAGSIKSPSVFWEDIFLSSLLFVTVVGGTVLARRNLRLGRGDRRGALRVASFVFCLSALAWALQAHHVPSFSEIGLFLNFLGYGLVVAGFVWMVYIALEPYARRLWPKGLISWSRLLSGRLRDPLVGRDILIGAAAGVFNQCWWGVYRLVVDHFSLPMEQPRMTSLISLSGTGETIGNYCELFAMALYMPVGWLLMVLLMRVLLRRQWVALLLITVFAVGTSVPGRANPALSGVFMLVAFSVFMLVLIRIGLLSAVFWAIYMYIASFVPLTLDSAAWFAGRSWFTLLLFAAIAGYGFWISLAGRPLVKPHVLEN